MQSRSVEFAKKIWSQFDVRSSLNDIQDHCERRNQEHGRQSSCAASTLDKNQAKVNPRRRPDKPAWPPTFSKHWRRHVNVDMIGQNISHGRGEPATTSPHRR